MNSERQSVSSSLRTLSVLCVSGVSLFLALYASSKARVAATQNQLHSEASHRNKRIANHPAASPATLQPDEPTMHPTKNRPSRLHGLSWWQFGRFGWIRECIEFSRIQFRERKSTRAAARLFVQESFGSSRTHLYEVAQRISRIH